MKKIILITVAAIIFSVPALKAQEPAAADSVKRTVFTGMPSCIKINQPREVEENFDSNVAKGGGEGASSQSGKNGGKSDGKGSNVYYGGGSRGGNVYGHYRICIFSDNSQNAREASSQALAKFQRSFPGVSASRTFSSPYFRVIVGNYRSKNEADNALRQIRGSFPKAHMVRQ